MLLTGKNTGGFEPVPAGTHIARCVQVLDIGTQHWTSPWGPKSGRKLRLVFELCNEKKVFDTAKGEESMMVGQEFLASLGKKANLRKLLESWRGRPFTEEELEGFDPHKMMGVAALVTIIHEKKDGETYGNISTVTGVPKGTIVPKATLPQVYFSLDEQEFDRTVFDNLPEWIRKKITASDEWKALMGMDDADQSNGHDDAEADQAAAEEGDGEIPF